MAQMFALVTLKIHEELSILFIWGVRSGMEMRVLFPVQVYRIVRPSQIFVCA